MTDAGALAENLLEHGITAMKIWPFDPAAMENGGIDISTEQLKTALEPFEQIRKRVGDKMDIMVEFHSLWNLTDRQAHREGAGALQADLVRRSDPHEFARRRWPNTRARPRCPGLRQRNAGIALALQGNAGPRRDRQSSWSICAGPAG